MRKKGRLMGEDTYAVLSILLTFENGRYGNDSAMTDLCLTECERM